VLSSVLVANRGEIARRVIRGCRALGVRAIAVYSEADTGWPHVTDADQAVLIGPAPARDSYLNVDRLLAAARETGAQAIHPGYGFLSENWRFARACEEAGLVFIGPSWRVIQQMGDKVEARRRMQAAGVPVVPGSEGALDSLEDAAALAERIGYPVMLKAAAGGGGIGMARVPDAAALPTGWASAQRRSQTAFGSGGLFVERYLVEARHVEVQVFGDTRGEVVHLHERECSVQRRHQKLIEEGPAPALDGGVKAKLVAAAVAGARAVGYVNAGTMEFIVKGSELYFLEMNTRLQVEHPVTEEVTGVDLVKEQISVAAGQPLSFAGRELTPRGHAIEFRVNAEDPVTFAPAPGRLTAFHPPGGIGVRVDTAAYQGYVIPPHYDSLIAKLIVKGQSRGEAISRARRALDLFVIEGTKTTIPMHRRILDDPDFVEGRLSTRFMERFAAAS
jgi:acetyl-CoA carboxylase biotin carboxylase subunit